MLNNVSSNETILVVGAGISGISAALEAAETGKQVILVEKNSYIGGRVTRLHQYLPGLCSPNSAMEINQQRAENNSNLTILTMAEVTSISGNTGNYSIELKLKPRYVSNDCTACGQCSDAVSAKFDSEFNYGLNKRKGAYIAYTHAYPQTYVLDPHIIGTDDAIKAANICPVNAIDLDMQEEHISFKAGAIIWATGWQPYDANKIQAYGYDRYPNVITSVEFERMNDPTGPTGGKIKRPSDGNEPKKIAFIQCAGSRDSNHLKHCSRICCMASLKQSHYVQENISDGTSDIYYIDIRISGHFEDFYKTVQNNESVKFIRSKVAFISAGEHNNPVLNGVDTEGSHRYSNDYDLVVLAIGMEPSVSQGDFPLEIVVNEAGFIERDEKNGGLFAAGCSTDTLDVSSAVQSATASSLHAVQVVNQIETIKQHTSEAQNTRHHIMVVGGGITGMTAAIEAARTGCQVSLVEKSNTLGGTMAKLYKRTPGRTPYTDPEDSDVAPLLKMIEENDKISIYLNSIISNSNGTAGHYNIDVSSYNAEGSTNADGSSNNTQSITCGAIIQAKGQTEYNARQLTEFNYTDSPDVVTQLEMETLAKAAAGSAINRPSDGKEVKNVVFIQCAGQRSDKEGHLPYCSGHCCNTSIKQAMYFKDNAEHSAAGSSIDLHTTILFTDLRTPGVAGENFYSSALRKGISFRKAIVSSVSSDSKVFFNDLILDDDDTIDADLVVLATGLIPDTRDNNETAVNDSDCISFPYKTQHSGIYSIGSARYPMSTQQAQEDAAGAILKAIQVIENAEKDITIDPKT